MSNFEPASILFPTDFGRQATAAFKLAEQLAKQYDCRVIALHVSNMPDMRGLGCHGGSYHDELRRELALLRSTYIAIEHVFCVDDPGPGICRLAALRSCRAIVMGVVEKQGLDRLSCGGVHEYVLQNAPCPVLSLTDHVEPPARTGQQWNSAER